MRALRPAPSPGLQSAAPESIAGTDGDDTLNGGGGDDTIDGGDGNDRLRGGTGIDVVSGGAGNDWLAVGTGGEDGEQLIGGSGSDTLLGGAGDDELRAEGTDPFDPDALDAATDINHLFAGDGADRLFGGDGLDRLHGEAGSDSIAGGRGRDLLDGGAGDDSLRGGLGDDIYVVDALGDAIVELADEGIDIVLTDLAVYQLGANVEQLRLAATGNADGYGNALDNTFFAGGGDNVMSGGAGGDTVSYRLATAGVDVWLALSGAQATGGSGSDTLASIEHLIGSTFADALAGNGGANHLRGGDGADTLAGGAGNDTLAGGDGDDLLRGGDGDDRLDGGAGIDTLSYSDMMAGVTVVLSDALAQATGGAGSDAITGVENLVGSAFADFLLGNSLANRIEGGNGVDTLIGGGGADVLAGGIGGDSFVFTRAGDSATAAMDTVLDFGVAQGDLLDLSLIDADTALADDQAFTFIGSAAFAADATGQLRYEGGIVYGSTDADADAEFAIALTGAPAITAADFIL